MKKILFVLLLSTFCFNGFAQDPELLNNNWYFNTMTIDGVEHTPDFEDYYYFISLDFDNDGTGADFKTRACEYLYADISYQNNNEFILSNLSQPPQSCEPDFEDFKTLYFNFYYNNQGDSFSYEIIDNVDDMSLIITDSFGNKVYYKNEQPIHPLIFQTWDLTHILQDLGDGDVNISNVDTPINPTITINENLEFTGYGSCNTFSGNFIFDDGDLTPYNFVQTTNNCDNEEHELVENKFFAYFKYEEPLYYGYGEIGNNTYFDLYSYSPGFYIKFKSPSNLATEEFINSKITIYPNPVSNTLFISTNNSVIDAIIIYSLTGKKVLGNSKGLNSIDVSILSKGLYFMEIYTDAGRSVKKFIKK